MYHAAAHPITEGFQKAAKNKLVKHNLIESQAAK